MDGSALEHSDSDSGESWTVLENTPSYADEAPEFAENLPKPGDAAENIDKDEDTDGISIISDSEPESTTPCDMGYEQCLLEESRPTDQQIPKYVSVNPIPSNNNNNQESVRDDDDDFLGDNNGKLKTYVHRRNKRLSTVLNIIVLGSVITAAGVAIGHMWGVRNECSMQTTPSVNKILSNLYKLQEENAFLRNKIKELTLMSNIQMHQKKMENDKVPVKPYRCKKVFEEPLNNQNAIKPTKCVDNESHAEKLLDSHMIENEYEKEFLNDLDKLRNVYQQNKSWLDEEIARRIKHEEHSIKNLKTNLKSPKSIRINEEHKILKDEKTRFKRQLDPTSDSLVTTETIINVTEPVQPVLTTFESVANQDVPEKRITYADSLKSDHIKKRDNKVNTESRIREHIRKRKTVKEGDTLSNSASEDELKKDDRYKTHKFKPGIKKNDHHKIYKKQKRRNKYEQWEMKGGYMKDYDDFSMTSSQENEFILKNPDVNYLRRDFGQNNYINQFSEPEDSVRTTDASESVEHKVKSENHTSKRNKGNGKNEKEMNWYEKRATLRNEARKKLEQELFGETTSNNAGWYFRRMQRREQCRVKGDNSTYKKLSKRIMNFKTKH